MPNPNCTISLSSLKQANMFVLISNTEQPKAKRIPPVCSLRSHFRVIISRHAIKNLRFKKYQIKIQSTHQKIID